MTLPVDWGLVHVTGTYKYLNGAPVIGRVVFTSKQVIVVDGVTVFPAAAGVDLDADGKLAIDLPATNDPDLSNGDWTFHVAESWPGGRSYDVVIPYTDTTVDLASLAPAVAPADAQTLATVARTGQATDLAGLQTVVDAAVAASPQGGISQAAADARYIKLTQINAASGVAGLDANKFVGESNLPLPPVTLTVLLTNKLA